VRVSRRRPEPCSTLLLPRVAIDNLPFPLDRNTCADELAQRVVGFVDGHPVLVLNDASSDEILSDQYTDDAGELRVVGSAY